MKPQHVTTEPGVCPTCDGENIWLLVYEDQDMEPVLFSNHGADEAARKAFEHAATKWTVRLFKCVAQDGYGHGTGQQPAQPGSGEVRPEDHPDYVGGIVWTEGELRWINARLTAAQQRYADGLEAWKANNAHFAARIAELREALRTYGWHKPECDYMQEELPCTCGFLTAVERDFPENSNG